MVKAGLVKGVAHVRSGVGSGVGSAAAAALAGMCCVVEDVSREGQATQQGCGGYEGWELRSQAGPHVDSQQLQLLLVYPVWEGFMGKHGDNNGVMM